MLLSTTKQRFAEGIVYLCHSAGKIMQLSAGLTALLQFALGPAEDTVSF